MCHFCYSQGVWKEVHPEGKEERIHHAREDCADQDKPSVHHQALLHIPRHGSLVYPFTAIVTLFHVTQGILALLDWIYVCMLPFFVVVAVTVFCFALTLNQTFFPSFFKMWGCSFSPHELGLAIGKINEEWNGGTFCNVRTGDHWLDEHNKWTWCICCC